MPAPTIEPEQARQLCAYSWPGNIRELSNVMERAAILSRGRVLELDQALTAGLRSRAPQASEEAQARPAPSAGPEPVKPQVTDDEDPEGPSAAQIEAALVDHGQVVAKAARALGLSRQALYRRMRRVGLVVERRARKG